MFVFVISLVGLVSSTTLDVGFPLVQAYNEQIGGALDHFYSAKREAFTELKVHEECPPKPVWTTVGELLPMETSELLWIGVYAYDRGSHIVKRIDFRKEDDSEEANFVKEKLILTILKGHYPNLVPEVFEVDWKNSGVSEYCSARSYITPNLGKALEPDDSIDLFQVAAQGLELLQQLHATGFVHGDVHAGNFLIDENDTLHLIDFGLAVPYVDESGRLMGPRRSGSTIFSDLKFLSPWHLNYPIISWYPLHPRDDLFRFAQMLCRLSSSAFREAEDAVDESYRGFYLQYGLPGAASMWARFKRRLPPDNVPEMFRAFYEYTLSLKVDTVLPDYDHWRKMFSEHAHKPSSRVYPLVNEYLAKIEAAIDTHFALQTSQEICPPQNVWLVGEQNPIRKDQYSQITVGSDSKVYEFGKNDEYIVKTVDYPVYRTTSVSLVNEKLVLKILRRQTFVQEMFEIDTLRSKVTALCGSRSYVTLNYGWTLKRFAPTNKLSMIAADGLRILKELHGTGFVHGDIHWKNFLMNHRDTSPKLQLIDFGFTRPFVDETGAHIKFGSLWTNNMLFGDLALSFLSPWHLASTKIAGYRSSVRDDIFRFAEVLYLISSDEYKAAYNAQKTNVQRSASDREAAKHWYEFKMANKTFKDVPPAFTAFHKYARSLRFMQAPNYDQWIAAFMVDS